MAATIMPSIASLINRLSDDYSKITFKSGVDYVWSASDSSISYNSDIDNSELLLLHELAHGLLAHQNYRRDIDLIKLERDAWDLVRRELAEKYEAKYDDNVVQDHLDTYRDWLHARSTCPACQATGLQTDHQHYNCLACGQKWHVNEARICSLRRTIITS